MPFLGSPVGILASLLALVGGTATGAYYFHDRQDVLAGLHNEADGVVDDYNQSLESSPFQYLTSRARAAGGHVISWEITLQVRDDYQVQPAAFRAAWKEEGAEALDLGHLGDEGLAWSALRDPDGSGQEGILDGRDLALVDVRLRTLGVDLGPSSQGELSLGPADAPSLRLSIKTASFADGDVPNLDVSVD